MKNGAIGTVSPEELKAFCADGVENCQAFLDEILRDDRARTKETTLTPVNRLFMTLGSLRSAVGLLRCVHPDAEVREAAEEGEREVSRFANELGLNRALYDVICGCDTSGLGEVDERFIRHTLRDFRRSGVDRDGDVREQVRGLREDLVALGQTFTRNIVTDVRSVSVDGAEDLEGLPADYIAEHCTAAADKVKITTDYPDYNPIMQYARNGELRRQLYMEFRKRGTPDNLDVLDQLLAKRHELAGLLGYSSWAGYATEDKMIKTPEAVREFVQRVSRIAEQKARREYERLLEYKRKDSPDAEEVFDWEKNFYEEQVKTESFQIDSREIRPYFEYYRVKDGIISLTESLFEIRFEAVADAPRWHEDVEVLDILEGTQHIGRLYLDMHPREGKFKHAAMFPLTTGVRGAAIPEGALVCNFPDPRRSRSGPALLSHDDVVTFFHEFGHLLHHILGSNQEWVEFSGCATEWDFVEVPSQLYEEWAWDYRVLQRFAVHHETGETIPEALVERMRRARDFGRGLAVRHQMFYAALSLTYYSRDPATMDSMTVLKELQNEYSLFRFVEGTHFQASFGHLDDYSALYYTYMWSLVISKDVFQTFKENGTLSPRIARRYRDSILAPGGSQDASDLVRAFLGRDYSFDAFEKWLDGGA